MLRLWFVSIGVTLALCALQASIMVSTKMVTQFDHQPNPLMLYQSNILDAVVGRLEDYTCAWHMETDGRNLTGSCQGLLLEEGHFYLTDIQSQDRRIVAIGLKIEDLRVGDLPQYWGQPVIEPYGQYTFARWLIDDYIVTAYSYTNLERFNYWSLISYMVIREI